MVPVRTPGIVRRHPELRWLASVAVIALLVVVTTTSVSGLFRNNYALPATNPDQLVAQVRAAGTTAYSGAIVAHVDLDLPASLTSALSDAAPVGGTLLHGVHTLRYWYGGAGRQRVAVVGPNAEQDVFRKGTQLLLWDTGSHTGERATLSKSQSGVLPLTLAPAAALTPPQLARRILDVTGQAGDTTLRSGDRIADRSTYELVVRPEPSASRIDSVHIEVDGLESVPLGVQIYARGAGAPAVDVSFTTVNFTEPSAQNFSFTPPAGSAVRSDTPDPLSSVLGDVAFVGAGWLGVGSYRSTAASAALVDGLLGDGARKVKGAWGTGRLLESPLLCVLVADHGQVVAGSVDPSVLYTAVRK